MEFVRESENHNKQKWLQEQQEIGSQVIILKDEETDTEFVVAQNDRFCLATLGRCDVNGYYGGLDVSFPEDDNNPAVAVYVIIDAKTMQIVYEDHEYFHLTVPYIPSFLAFREIEPMTRLVNKQLRDRPELRPLAILVDGNGILHPRCAGIACFVGVRIGIPSIGVGKTIFAQGGLSKEVVWRGMDDMLRDAVAFIRTIRDLGTICLADKQPRILIDSKPICGTHDKEPEEHDASIDRGSMLHELSSYCHGLAVPLQSMLDEKALGRTLACALVGHGGRLSPDRRSSGSKVPIFVSVGHNISLQSAVDICAILSLVRIPEPIRQADLIGRRMLRTPPTKPKNP